MAATKTLVFTGINVGGTDYSNHLNEGFEVTLEQLTDLVRDGQTLVSAWDVSFSVLVYDDAPLSDSNIVSNTAQTPALTTVTFTGATGTDSIVISDVIVNASKVYDQNRMAVQLTGTKRAVSLANAVTESS